jgi:hypothetical protein
MIPNANRGLQLNGRYQVIIVSTDQVALHRRLVHQRERFMTITPALAHCPIMLLRKV